MYKYIFPINLLFLYKGLSVLTAKYHFSRGLPCERVPTCIDTDIYYRLLLCSDERFDDLIIYLK